MFREKLNLLDKPYEVLKKVQGGSDPKIGALPHSTKSSTMKRRLNDTYSFKDPCASRMDHKVQIIDDTQSTSVVSAI